MKHQVPLVFGNVLSIIIAILLGLPRILAANSSVVILDAGLDTAVRDALRKPAGALTEEDLLSLTVLAAEQNGISNLAGLQYARNLTTLSLPHNNLANLVVPGELTKLAAIDLSFNPLVNCVFPDELTNLTYITIRSSDLVDVKLPDALTAIVQLDLRENHLTNFTLPSSLQGLGYLNLSDNQLTSFFFPSSLREMDNVNINDNGLTDFNIPENLTNMIFLDLSFNSLTNCTLPAGMTLDTLLLQGNALTQVILPPGLSKLIKADISQNLLNEVLLPADMTNVIELNFFYNQLSQIDLPRNLPRLHELDLDFNQLSTIELPPTLSQLELLHLRSNRFTQFSLPAELNALTYLDVSENPLRSITLPSGLNHLQFLRLSENRLTNLTLPVGLTSLEGINLTENLLTNLVLPGDLNQLNSLNIGANQLSSLTLPSGMSNLAGLFFPGNLLTHVTLPPDMTSLTNLGFISNPLQTIVMPVALVETNLAEIVEAFRGQGTAVFGYPSGVRLTSDRPATNGIFNFTIGGPPGNYSVLGSSNLLSWENLGSTTNIVGTSDFSDVSSNLTAGRYYRALLQMAPSNMVLIPPNSFTMGSSTNELGRDTNESPQTTVILSRGFWIGKFEVTQLEYLSVMNTNPSAFSDNLARAVSSVSWLDATNYCWELTQQELAAGRIPSGSQFRLPTEAEWECAARAGTTTRFSFGDDSDPARLKDYAWFAENSGNPRPIVRPGGQKLPNAWGLYDMEGNVLEWCQDWLGALPGGVVSDPTGPDSNPIGFKVIRGGAYDSGASDCRSARRLFFGVSPFLTDTDLGFRVVLDTGR